MSDQSRKVGNRKKSGSRTELVETFTDLRRVSWIAWLGCLKFDNQKNSNMQNSMMIFTFSVFDQKYLFWVNLVQKKIFVSLCWSLLPILIRICTIQWSCSLFLFLTKIIIFGAHFTQKFKIVNLSWYLVPTPI